MEDKVDEKLLALFEFDRWKRLFPVFIEKRIGAGELVELAQPAGRLELAREITEGRFSFGIPTEKEIPKDDGGTRTVTILPDRGRIVMSLILDVYLEKYGYLIHPNCLSYQKGVGTPKILKMIQRKVREGTPGWKLDISKYFDSVPIGIIEAVLQRLNTGSVLDRLLWEYYHDNRVIRDGKVIPKYKSLGQGCAFSVLLANLVLAELDEEIAKEADVYYRYSDDILVMGENCDELLQRIESKLSSYGLEIKPEKMKRVGDGPFDFLGGRVSTKGIGLTKKHREKFKKTVRKLCSGKGRKAQKAAVKKLQSWLFQGEKCPADYYLDMVTLEEDVVWMDEYCKDQLKAVYTGKQNRVTNLRGTSNEQLREMGWFSLVAVWKEFRNCRAVYETRKRWLLNRPEGELRVVTPEEAEQLWEYARLYEGKTSLATEPEKERTYGYAEYCQITKAARELEQCKVEGDGYYWQSQVYPSLVLFN